MLRVRPDCSEKIRVRFQRCRPHVKIFKFDVRFTPYTGRENRVRRDEQDMRQAMLVMLHPIKAGRRGRVARLQRFVLHVGSLPQNSQAPHPLARFWRMGGSAPQARPFLTSRRSEATRAPYLRPGGPPFRPLLAKGGDMVTSHFGTHWPFGHCPCPILNLSATSVRHYFF
jgi:hypothetical protein